MFPADLDALLCSVGVSVSAALQGFQVLRTTSVEADSSPDLPFLTVRFVTVILVFFAVMFVN